jgi:hypothetical protein
MKIEEIIFILENKVRNLEQQRSIVVTNGDLEAVTLIDSQIAETNITLNSLKSS